MRVQAPLDGEAPPTLGTLERLLHVGPVDGLMRFELEDLGEGFPAVPAAQRLLLPPRVGSLRSSWRRPELEGPFGSGSQSWVTSILGSRLEPTRDSQQRHRTRRFYTDSPRTIKGQPDNRDLHGPLGGALGWVELRRPAPQTPPVLPPLLLQDANGPEIRRQGG